MSLIHKVMRKSGRELFLFYPGDKKRTAFKRCSITVLMDNCDEKTANEALTKLGLDKLSKEYEIIISFIAPTKDGFNYKMEEVKADDVAAFAELQSAMNRPTDDPLPVGANGIPSFAAMMDAWHPMNDTKYLIGIGEGASMALTLAACYPDNIAAVLTVGGKLCDEALAKAVYSAVPVAMIDADKKAADYFKKANSVDTIDENERRIVYSNSANPLESVTISKYEGELTEDLVKNVWLKMFSKVRRPNTGAHGNVEPRFDINEAGFEFFIDDSRLADGKKHTWFTHVPSCVKENPEKKVPIMFFYHGASDNPHEAAEMSKFHELGEKEGFITVYPWGTNLTTWNSGMDEGGEDDVLFCKVLIDYMLENYPVDPERVYVSGFSNGAAMAQVIALVHPEMVAACCHIDSNWPGQRAGACEVDFNDVIPFRIAMEKKKEYDYRMPCWYTYGTREPSYPVYKGCTQQHQYDFWKLYNNIEIKPTPEIDNPDPSGCGVVGDINEKPYPSDRHKEHFYDIHRFFTKDETPENYYNYVMMHDKGHDIAHMDPKLGWDYVKQFKRNKDGSVGKVEE